jgi:hypothetical protein
MATFWRGTCKVKINMHEYSTCTKNTLLYETKAQEVHLFAGLDGVGALAGDLNKLLLLF